VDAASDPRSPADHAANVSVASPSAASLPVPSAEQALRTLTDAVARLALAEGMEDVERIVCAAARRLTGADGAAFVLRDGAHGFYVCEEAIGPLWNGARVPLTDCIGGWAMLNRKPAVVEDVYADDRIAHDAYRPTFVRSLAVVPIRTQDPIGAIGLYWAQGHAATEQEVGLARALADSTALAVQSIRVAERFERASRASGRRLHEVQVLQRAEPDAAETDELTGLPNRSHWDRAVAESLRPGEQPVCIALMDLDRFRTYNEVRGHQAGDALLRLAAVTWRSKLRPNDLLARYGGEEFAIVLTQCDADAAQVVAQRLRSADLDGQTASIGYALWDGEESADSVVCRADEALYRAKQAGRDRVVFAP
jgi:diguanylate cyclase (GGDEF)-like protein